MRIAESVLRGLIREALLEDDSAYGDLPGKSINVKDKNTLKSLQSLIGADATGVYDDQTENKWDEFIDMNIGSATINDSPGLSVSNAVRQDWKTTASLINSVNGSPVKYSPDIKGMLSFAKALKPVNVQTTQTVNNNVGVKDVGEAPPTGPYRTEAQPDVWPTGVTLDDAKEWDVNIDGKFIFDGPNGLSPAEMYDRYDDIKEKISEKKYVAMIGLRGTRGATSDQLDAGAAHGVKIPDVTTLDKIFKGTDAELGAKSELETRFDEEDEA